MKNSVVITKEDIRKIRECKKCARKIISLSKEIRKSKILNEEETEYIIRFLKSATSNCLGKIKMLEDKYIQETEETEETEEEEKEEK